MRNETKRNTKREMVPEMGWCDMVGGRSAVTAAWQPHAGLLPGTAARTTRFTQIKMYKTEED